jgi:hypothetical protein
MPAIASLLLVLAQTGSAKVDAVYIGHSLQSDIPDMVMALSDGRFSFKEQFIPGAPLRWQWDEPTRPKTDVEPHYQGRYNVLINSGTEVLVMVESVPRGEAPSMEESLDYTSHFLAFARSKNPNIRVFYYEPWHHITSGTPEADRDDRNSPTRTLRWRPRLKADRPKWDRVVAEANRKAPGKVPLKLIPAASALGQLSDEIEAGRVPGLRSARDLFDDTIHLNPLGKYFVACLHYRAIFGGTVSGKPFEIRNRWGGAYWDEKDWQGKVWKKPAAATIRAMHRVADSVIL